MLGADSQRCARSRNGEDRGVSARKSPLSECYGRLSRSLSSSSPPLQLLYPPRLISVPT